jgi:hypothetical protein
VIGQHTVKAANEKLQQQVRRLETQLAALADRVAFLEQHAKEGQSWTKTQVARLDGAGVALRNRVDALDGGQHLAIPASNPLAETMADTPQAAADLAKRNAAEAAASLTDRLGPGSGRHLADKSADDPSNVPPPSWALRGEAVTWGRKPAPGPDGEETQQLPAAQPEAVLEAEDAERTRQIEQAAPA